jgi:hypothetical protein
MNALRAMKRIKTRRVGIIIANNNTHTTAKPRRGEIILNYSLEAALAELPFTPHLSPFHLVPCTLYPVPFYPVPRLTP